MRTIRWGIIGTGSISSTFATALNSLKHVEIVAVASRSLSKAEAFSEKFHVKKAYSSYEELVKDPEVDVVYIGTPHTQHKENASVCLKYGKAVLCEKPFTLNYEDSKYLVDLAREKNVFLMEAMWTKFLPVTKAVKQWLKEERVGKLKFFRVNFGFQKEFDLESRWFSPQLAGGALLDVGIYPITYVIHMMDRLPDQVVSKAYLGKSNVDEMNVITFQYEKEGVLAELSSAVSTELGKDALIVGEKGKIVVPNFWMADSAQCYDEKGTLIDSISKEYYANGYVFEAEEVNQCLRDGKLESDVLPLLDTLDIMKLMDTLRKEWGLVYPMEQE